LKSIKWVAVALGLVAAGTASWLIVSHRAPKTPGAADEREIRELVRELERDVNRSGLVEIFTHVVHDEEAHGPHRDETEDEKRVRAVMSRFEELAKIEGLRFVDVQIRSLGDTALVKMTARGFRPDAADQQYLEPISLRLKKGSGGWKIVDVLPELQSASQPESK